MFYAIKNTNGNRNFFDSFNGKEFETHEELTAAIEAWKSAVTPAIAQATTFELFQDSEQ